jgi:hypothetical protein
MRDGRRQIAGPTAARHADAPGFQILLALSTMLRSTVATLLMLLAPGGAGAWQVGAPVGQSAAPSAAAHRLPSPRCQEEPFGATEPPEFPAKQFPECDFPGCDGNGRAIGGLGAIPLFEWWPIKVRHAAVHARAPKERLAQALVVSVPVLVVVAS